MLFSQTILFGHHLSLSFGSQFVFAAGGEEKSIHKILSHTGAECRMSINA